MDAFLCKGEMHFPPVPSPMKLYKNKSPFAEAGANLSKNPNEREINPSTFEHEPIVVLALLYMIRDHERIHVETH